MKFNWLIVLILFVFTGCASNKMYRPVGDDALKQMSSSNGQVDYSLAFVEFDDQGEFWDPNQLLNAVNHIEEETRKNESGVIVITFIQVRTWRDLNNFTRPDSLICS